MSAVDCEHPLDVETAGGWFAWILIVGVGIAQFVARVGKSGFLVCSVAFTFGDENTKPVKSEPHLSTMAFVMSSQMDWA